MACESTVDIQLTHGWYINENMKIEIEYFAGSPYPANIAEVETNSDDEDWEGSNYISDSDDSDIYESESDS